jgi:hypothetical protein
MHPVIAEIPEDDPELLKILAGIRTPVLRLSEIIESGPHGRQTVYNHIDQDLLLTFVSMHRRFAYAIDYARYLLALKRLGERDGQRHHLAKAENRPRHDPKRKRGT